MSIYIHFGAIIGLILIFLMAISLILIDNGREGDNEEDYDIEIINFDDSFDGNIDFDFGNIVLDDNTDSMSEISEFSNIQSV